MRNLFTSVMMVAADGASFVSGRLVPAIAALVGLIGVVLGGLALARSARNGAGSRPFSAFASSVAGLVSAAVGGYMLPTPRAESALETD